MLLLLFKNLISWECILIFPCKNLLLSFKDKIIIVLLFLFVVQLTHQICFDWNLIQLSINFSLVKILIHMLLVFLQQLILLYRFWNFSIYFCAQNIFHVILHVVVDLRVSLLLHLEKSLVIRQQLFLKSTSLYHSLFLFLLLKLFFILMLLSFLIQIIHRCLFDEVFLF